MDCDHSTSEMYRPCIEQAENQKLDDDVGLGNSDRCSSIQQVDDSELVGAPVVVTGDAGNIPTTLTVVANMISSEKRKRGRPPRGQAAKPPPAKRQREEEEEEDVCFICFDGGSLVLCDRKACPKAYHPACIKRDEAFFASTAKWYCGWHICSVCQKASQYMCYTCTYSLCKGCTKDSDFLCVRGNKGLCKTCMRTIMLFENKGQGDNETVQVDFDDKSSWEYLFKIYWVYLKEKRSLTLSELIQAKNPWKESHAVHGKRQQLPYGHRVVDGKGIVGKHLDYLELKKPKELLEPPTKDPPSTQNRTIDKADHLNVPDSTPHLELMQPKESKDSLKTEQASIARGTSVTGCMKWASKELLELVAHVKNGDTSALSQFDVQALLLDYIKRNNLRDPRRKSQIICDLRLKSIFGKPRLGHIEMLKLLEFHFLIKEDSQKSTFIPAGIVGTVTSHVEADYNNTSLLINKNKKRKTCRNTEEKLTQINLDGYAAIDAHNIHLIYLRRGLMENLIEDMEKFHDRVIGSVVRIRISGNDQKQEMYRLVHVVDTSKASEPYKIGDKIVDVLLEVLNLNKKEFVPIDSISNQDFSEDECRRLRQSIKCGLVKRLTVGEIQKKTMALRTVKLNDSLEAEILRLNHLRDRASEKGRKKELRECVEKLELLKTPEERGRRLHEIPEVHVDPKMNPNYESEENIGESDDNKQVEYEAPRYTTFSKRLDKLMSSGSKEDGYIMARCKMSEKREVRETNVLEKLGNQGIADKVVDRSAYETSSLSTAKSTSTNNSDTDKLWHYCDPNGRVQGPFSVMQLRKWNMSGLFPSDMRIWTNDKHDGSVLLTNALNGLFHNAPREHGKISHQSQELGAASDKRNRVEWCGSALGAGRECGEREVPWHLRNTVNQSNGDTEFTRMDGLSPSFPQCLDLLKGNNSYPDTPQLSSPVPGHGKVHVALPHKERHNDNVDFQSASSHVIQDSCETTMCQITDGYSRSIQSNSQSHFGQSSGQNWGSLTSIRSSINLDSGSRFASVNKSSNSFEEKGIINFPDLPSPTPKPRYDDIEAQAAEKLLSLSLNFPTHASDIQDLPSPTPKSNGEAQGGKAAVNQHSGPSWSSASSLVIGGAQLPEIADEWGGYSPTAKLSAEEWDSGLASFPSLKPAKAVGDHVDTPTSNEEQLNHTSPSHPVLNLSSWQALFGEPIEFSTLAEESVSDLLAEVDAMESKTLTQSGIGSPTSAMRCSDQEMIPGCKRDYFGSIEDLSPTPDPAKSDTLSSTGDIQLSCQSSVTDDLVGASQADAFDPLKRSRGNSSTSSEGETKTADFFPTQVEAGFNAPAPCTMSQKAQNTGFSAMGRSTGQEAIATGRGAAPGNMSWGGPVQGYTNVGQGSSMGTGWGNSHMNHDTFTGNPLWDSQGRYMGKSAGGPRDWALQGGESGFGRGRPSLSKQQTFGGGGYSRPLPKGQQVCKFYESGRCKKGASCDYLHR